MTEKAAVTVERVVLELTKIAFADIGDVLDQTGDLLRVRNLSELSNEVRAAISEISDTDTKLGTKRTVKLHSKLTALDMLMRHLGGYVTLEDIVNRLTPEQAEEITQKLLTKIQSNEKGNQQAA